MDKILIVDDNEQITRVLRTYAEQEGYDVDVALDGSHAWQMFQANNYDLVLLSGNGIGLALARQIADFHKIEINVSSNPKTGVHFKLFIPAEQVLD